METRTKPPEVLTLAREYVAAGLSVVPILTNGTKRPALAWKEYQQRRPTDAELVHWWGPGSDGYGVAIIGGKVSGGLEVLDVDDAGVWSAWSALVEQHHPGLLDRLPQVLTPSGGMHVYYRTPEPAGNLKLALAANGVTLIETRGEGGYVLAPGCPPACHAAGKSYVLVNASLRAIPQLPADLRESLLAIASSWKQHVKPGLTWDRPPENGAALRPGDDYNRRAGWPEVLEPAGWVATSRSGDITYWRRPGKQGKVWSATTGHCRGEDGRDLLYVFSSSAAPFEPGCTYSRFAAYTLLNHAGDYRAAARVLAGKGYGEQRPPSPAAGTNGRVNGTAGLPPAVPAKKSAPILVQLSTVTPEPVEWLMDGWLPQGALSILDGDPGLGKSTLTLDLAARVSRGWKMPPEGGPDPSRQPGTVLLLGAEDSLKHTVRPRLDAAGADTARVISLEGMKVGDEDRDPVLPWDLFELAEWITENRVQLVIVDPLMAFIEGEQDAHKDQVIRRAVMRPLRKLAERLNVAILLLRHLNKNNGGAALYRGGGSIGITGGGRSSMLVGRDPHDPKRHVLAMNKINIAANPRSLAFRIVPADGVSRIEWEGPCDLTRDDVLWHNTAQPPSHERDQLEEARRFLADMLSGGPVRMVEVEEAAHASLIAKRTLQLAKTALKVVSKKEARFQGAWFWSLPNVRESSLCDQERSASEDTNANIFDTPLDSLTPAEPEDRSLGWS